MTRELGGGKMRYLGSNKIVRFIIYISFLFLIGGLISLHIADSKKVEYGKFRDRFVGKLENYKELSHKELLEIETSINGVNKEFHTLESVAVYLKRNGNTDISYYDLDLKDAEHLFPSNSIDTRSKKELFTVSEGFEVGNYFIVHRYIPDSYYAFPITLFTFSGILFIIWLISQIRYAYDIRQLKYRLLLSR